MLEDHVIRGIQTNWFVMLSLSYRDLLGKKKEKETITNLSEMTCFVFKHRFLDGSWTAL